MFGDTPGLIRTGCDIKFPRTMLQLKTLNPDENHRLISLSKYVTLFSKLIDRNGRAPEKKKFEGTAPR